MRQVNGRTFTYVSTSFPDVPLLDTYYIPWQVDEHNKSWPGKRNVLFRSDPAVVVVSLNWHLRATAFGKTVYQHLAMKYKDHEQRVCVYFICTQVIR